MNKKLTLLILLPSLLLTGCGGIATSFENAIQKESGVEENEEYKNYKNYTAAGKVTDEGYYSEDVFNEETESSSIEKTVPENTAHISFSTNEYLDVKYYRDAEKQDSLNESKYDLKEGEKIFADVTVSSEAVSSMYDFSGFSICEYDDEGIRQEITRVVPDDTGFVLEITSDYIDKNLSN